MKITKQPDEITDKNHSADTSYFRRKKQLFLGYQTKEANSTIVYLLYITQNTHFGQLSCLVYHLPFLFRLFSDFQLLQELRTDFTAWTGYEIRQVYDPGMTGTLYSRPTLK